MIEMEVAEMKTYKPVAVTRRSQSVPPHIPRQMPAIYQVLEGIGEGVKLLEKAVYQRCRKETLKQNYKNYLF
jgi:hypothetical protein